MSRLHDGACWTAYGRYHFRRDGDDIFDRIFLQSGWLNRPRRTFYLGRGLFGDTNRLHRGILFRHRDRDDDFDDEE